jgi:hypothetical protein
MKTKHYLLAIVLLMLAVLALVVDHMQQADRIDALKERLEEEQILLTSVQGDTPQFCGDLPAEQSVPEPGEKAMAAKLRAVQAVLTSGRMPKQTPLK